MGRLEREMALDTWKREPTEIYLDGEPGDGFRV